LVTQYIDDDENQAENLLTPQSGSYDTDTQPSLLRGPRSNVQEEVGPDFRPATSFSALTLTTDDVAAAISHDPTRLADGRLSMIIDPGSVSNLCGSRWAQDMAENAFSQDRRPTYELRPRPLKIGGVGTGEQVCYHDKRLPVALRTTNGSKIVEGEIFTPVVDSSNLPGLLGLNALRRNRAVLDFNTLQLHV
jgi:hypothetical protein